MTIGIDLHPLSFHLLPAHLYPATPFRQWLLILPNGTLGLLALDSL